MKDIKYQIEFHSPWHCGSGLSAGADLDALVIKDKDGLPYIPGKTLKGLIREAVENIEQFSGLSHEDLVIQVFGNSDHDNMDETRKGEAFFTNAELEESQRIYILQNNLTSFLYDSVSSTAIDEQGIAKKHSLRRREVTVPCKLFASIHFVDDKLYPTIIKAFSMIKRLGTNRSRGLGRCTISEIK